MLCLSIDLIADSAVGLILQLFSTPSVLRMSMSAGRRKCVAHKAAAGNEGSSSGTHAGSMEVAAESTSLKGRFSLSLAEERGSASKRLRTGEVDPSNAIPAAIGTVLPPHQPNSKLISNPNTSTLCASERQRCGEARGQATCAAGVPSAVGKGLQEESVREC